MAKDFWGKYTLFANQWAWTFWLLLVLSIGWLGYYFITDRKVLERFHAKITAGAVVAFGFSFLFLVQNQFFKPERAVIVASTSYYDFPSFGAESFPMVLSPGETVQVLDKEDIWVEVEAGDKRYWVPQNVARDL